MKKGFTLIELLVVIIIVAILASVVAPIYRDMTVRAKFTELFTVMGVIERSMQLVILEHGWSSQEIDKFWDTNVTEFSDNSPFMLSSLSINPVAGGSVNYCYFTVATQPDPQSAPITLCARVFYNDGRKRWYIYDDHYWAEIMRSFLKPDEIIETLP